MLYYWAKNHDQLLLTINFSFRLERLDVCMSSSQWAILSFEMLDRRESEKFVNTKKSTDENGNGV